MKIQSIKTVYFSDINLNFDANQTLENSKNIFAQIWQDIVDFFTGLFR